jgi:CBS domain-containing protein
VREVLAGIRVSRFLKLDAEVPVLRSDEPLAAVLDRFDTCQYPVLPLVDGGDSLLGVVNLEEVHVASRSSYLGPWVVAADLMREVTPLRPDDRLDRAQELFIENNLLALPVVTGDQNRVVGLVRRSDVAQTYLRRVHGLSNNEVPETPRSDSSYTKYHGPDGL